MKILVTVLAGKVGSRLAPCFLAKGLDIGILVSDKYLKGMKLLCC